MELAFSKYTVAVVKEYADKVTFYMNNHDNGGSNKTEVIKIYGCKSTPSCDISSRANGTAQITKEWKDDVYTLTVSHNGPLDLSVNCSGNAMNVRLNILRHPFRLLLLRRSIRELISMKLNVLTLKMLLRELRQVMVRQYVTILHKGT